MRRGILSVFYTWGVILCSVSVLASVADSLDLDLIRELLVMAALWLMAEGLTVSLPQGQLSASWAVALTLFLAYGLPAVVWTGGVVTILGQRLFSQGEPWRTTLFNAGQSVCAFWLANAAYLYVGSALGSQAPLAGTLQVLAFTGTYYAANHLLVFFFLWPRRRYHPMVLWREALKWDALTYLFTLPLGYLMFLLWEAMTYWAAVLLFIPALTLQFVLRLYIVLVLTNRELTALYHVARRLGESVSLEKTLDFVLEAVRRVVPYRTGVIYVWSEDQKAFMPAAVSGPFAKQIRESAFGQGEGFIGWVAETREPEIVHDTREDPRFRSETGFVVAERSLIVIPLVTEREVLGVFLLGARWPYAFSERSLSLLTIVGGQAAVAIENTRLFAQIERLAQTEPVTGVLNRRYFLLRSQAECERALEKDEPVAVILADIDNFGKFNDLYGPLVGDAALREVARVLRNFLRGSDLLARYGGDEFAVLLPGAAETVARETAERLRGAVERHLFGVEGVPEPLKVKISLGVAVFPSDGATLPDVLQKASRALREAVNRGGNTTVLAGGVKNVGYFR